MYFDNKIVTSYFSYSGTILLPQEHEREQEHNLTSTTTASDTQQV